MHPSTRRLSRRFTTIPRAPVTAAYRKFALLEALIVFSLLMLYIWRLRDVRPGTWMPILGLMFVSHLLHGEGYARVGLGRHNLRAAMRTLGPLVAVMGLVTAAGGVLMHTIRPIDLSGAATALGLYLPWGLLQQYVVNGYFLNRFDASLSSRTANLMAAAVFCVAHTPNWFLMPVSFIGGYCATLVYRRYRCLYFLGIAHAVAGFLIFMVVPDWITHHLRVGPGWFQWQLR